MNYENRLKNYYYGLKRENKRTNAGDKVNESNNRQKKLDYYLSLTPFDPELSKEFLYFRSVIQSSKIPHY